MGSIEPVLVVPESTTTTLEDIFARFLALEVGDGAASLDTIRNYLSQTKQYLDWCRDNLLPPLDAEAEDIKLYRQYLVQSRYANSTIATKLNIVRIFYKAALDRGLIANNPALKIKAPLDRKDPAARITFMEAEELKYLLDYIQSQLDRAKTNKQKLPLLRDRANHACDMKYKKEGNTFLVGAFLPFGFDSCSWGKPRRYLWRRRFATRASPRPHYLTVRPYRILFVANV
jgi:hypothetical protein